MTLYRKVRRLSPVIWPLVGGAPAQTLEQRPGEDAVHPAVGHGRLERALGLRGQGDERGARHARAHLVAQPHPGGRNAALVVHAAVHPQHRLAEALRPAQPAQPGVDVHVAGAPQRRLGGKQGPLLQGGREPVTEKYR